MHLVVLMCQLCSELQIVGIAMQAIDVNDKASIIRAIYKHKRVLEYGEIICRDFADALVLQHLGMSVATSFTAISVLYVSFN